MPENVKNSIFNINILCRRQLTDNTLVYLPKTNAFGNNLWCNLFKYVSKLKPHFPPLLIAGAPVWQHKPDGACAPFEVHLTL